jgi:Domain of unknown function (DUF4419)
VWIAILCQFSFYMNKHSEEFRKCFVQHEGKKELIVKHPPAALENLNWEYICTELVKLADKELVDRELKAWMTPTFSTTTDTDRMVCTVMTMATLKKYFNYICQIMCGIPKITLQGEKADWEDIYQRLDKLTTWKSEELKEWYGMLKPVLKRFVSAFDGDVDQGFWRQIIKKERYGCGTAYISGWITAFCPFTKDGDGVPVLDGYDLEYDDQEHPYELDGARYLFIDTDYIPIGSAEVNIKIVYLPAGPEYMTTMLAGNMAMKITSGIEGEGDTVQNEPMWACYLRNTEKEDAEERKK